MPQFPSSVNWTQDGTEAKAILLDSICSDFNVAPPPRLENESCWPLGWLVLLGTSQAVGRSLGRRLWPGPGMSWAASQCWAVTQSLGMQSWGLSRALGHTPHSLTPGVSPWCPCSEGNERDRSSCSQRARSSSRQAGALLVRSKVVPFHRGQGQASLVVPRSFFFFFKDLCMSALLACISVPYVCA